MFKRNKKNGFTFVELAVAIAIMVVLASVLVPSFIHYVESSRMRKDEAAMREVVRSVEVAVAQPDVLEEIYDYSVENNYSTYTDSTGVLGVHEKAEEAWTPSGSMSGMTITFHPSGDSSYELAKGKVNQMNYSDGRKIDVEKQCSLGDLPKLNTSMQAVVGKLVGQTSSTYRDSCYTVFVKIEVTGHKLITEVNGSYNGMNLSEVPTNPFEFDDTTGEEPIEAPTEPKPINPGEDWIPGPEIDIIIGDKTRPEYTAPTGKTLTYTGAEQELVNPGTVNGGTMYYSLDCVAWGTAIPTAAEVGTYTISYYIKGDENHLNIGSEIVPINSVEATILPSNATAQAVFCDDNSLLFLNRPLCEPGQQINGKTILNVYTDFNKKYYSYSNVPWASIASRVEKVEVLDAGIQPISLSCWFAMMNNCRTIDISKLDTSKTVGMMEVFMCCSSLTDVVFGSNFKTDNVVNMREMFFRCEKLTSLDLHSWNTSKCVDMNNMFAACYSLVSLNLKGAFSTENTDDMLGMFASCKSIETLDLSNFNTQKVQSIGWMFQRCDSLKSIIWGNNFVTSNATDMRRMFHHCISLTELDLSSFDTSSVKGMDCMFYECFNLQRVTFPNSFEFKKTKIQSTEGTNPYLPTPSSTYIPGATGQWYDISTGIGYAAENIPENTAATYVAVKPVVKGALVNLTSDGILPTDTIGDDTYRILAIGTTIDGVFVENPDGSEIKVLKMKQKNISVFSLTCDTTTFGTTKGIKYADSIVDTTMRNLYTGNTIPSNIKNAIIPQNIMQSMYTWIGGTNDNADVQSCGIRPGSPEIDSIEDDYYMTKKDAVNVGQRYVYALDIDDVIDYLGRNYTPQELNTMFFDTESSKNEYVWLRSAYATGVSWADGSGNAFYVNGDNGYIKKFLCNRYSFGVRPAFVIDLALLN